MAINYEAYIALFTQADKDFNEVITGAAGKELDGAEGAKVTVAAQQYGALLTTLSGGLQKIGEGLQKTVDKIGR